jgi:hypothetical protein
MMNWLNRQKSSIAAAAVAVDSHTSPTDWYNRGSRDTNRNTARAQPVSASRRNKLKYLEVFSLAVVVCLIVGLDIYIFNINKRLNALENGLVEVKAWAFPASLLEGKYASLNARVRALTAAFSGLDARFGSLAPPQRQVTALASPAEAAAMPASIAESASEAPAAGVVQSATRSGAEAPEFTGVVSRSEEGTPGENSLPVLAPSEKTPVTSSIPVVAPAEETPLTPVSTVAAPAEGAGDKSAAGTTPAVNSTAENPLAESGKVPVNAATAATDTVIPQEAGKTGPWVINLLSDPNVAVAERFAVKARKRGVPVEQNQVEVNNRTVWRVQITGFATAKEAQAHAKEIKDRLRLNEVWIFKQRG